MPKILYQEWNPKPGRAKIVQQANEIIDDYQGQGFDLTIRQLYYRFVALGFMDNTMRNYKNLIDIMDRARKAGLTDWNAIVDRTRNLQGNPHWSSPADIVRGCARQFRYDLWKDQPNRVEVWIEKDALIGVIEGICREWDVDYFACRGNVSQSEQWRAGRRFQGYRAEDQYTTVLHLGDHDPNGIDMTRDNQDRLTLFAQNDETVHVHRIALNMDQVEEYDPPPYPTKLEDSRAMGYIERYGNDSWELDALEPQVIIDLIDGEIRKFVDIDLFDARKVDQQDARDRIQTIADQMEDDDE